jgi:hypothetical protein
MIVDNSIKHLEQERHEIISFSHELDKKLIIGEIDPVEHETIMNNKLGGRAKHEILADIQERIKEIKDYEHSRHKKMTMTAIAFAVVMMALMISLTSQSPGSLTGFTTLNKPVTQAVNYNQAFEHYTETQLDFTKVIGLKISGTLEGAGAKVKLRINGTDYLVADIKQQQDENQGSLITGLAPIETPAEPAYALTTDKKEYAVGETVTLTLTPDTADKSFYIEFGTQTERLESNNYLTQGIGEYQAIALVVLPNDILRLETNFAVIEQATPAMPNETTNTTNESNATETTPPPSSTTGFAFSSLCTDTCIIPETDNPVLIIEPEANSTLTITAMTITQAHENQAPGQTKQITDISLVAGQATSLELSDYFSDPEGDTIHYDINDIPEINATITQSNLEIASQTPGVYTAFIYATDGDKLATSNAFSIIITQAEITETNQSEPTTNETTSNETTNQTNETTNQTTTPTADACSNPDANQRPAYCFVGIEDQVFKDLSAELTNTQGGTAGRFTRFGNLIIKGLLIENATETPKDNDFKISYTQTSGFNEITTYTAWIGSETGNLYLKGKLYQEKEILEPPQFNSYIIKNRFGIVLAYFDQLTGDLYLKGNIVQLGSIT